MTANHEDIIDIATAPEIAAGMTHDEKVVLYAVDHLESLKAKGFVVGGNHRPTSIGIAVMMVLKAEGFRPKFEELKDTIGWLQRARVSRGGSCAEIGSLTF